MSSFVKQSFWFFKILDWSLRDGIQYICPTNVTSKMKPTRSVLLILIWHFHKSIVGKPFHQLVSAFNLCQPSTRQTLLLQQRNFWPDRFYLHVYDSWSKVNSIECYTAQPLMTTRIRILIFPTMLYLTELSLIAFLK